MYQVAPIEIWVKEIRNRPGELAEILSRLHVAGSHLEVVVARPHDAGSSVVFVAPLLSESEVRAAHLMGLEVSENMHALRIAGPDDAGLGARITRVLADARLNIRGVTGAAMGGRMVLYVRFENRDDKQRGLEALRANLQI